MIALKSYLIRAVRDWAVDQGLTPHIVVDAFHSGTLVPPDYVHDGRIVLNIHPRAVMDFELGEEWIRFAARFGAQSRTVDVPVAAVMAAYARENGQGISFGEKESSAEAGTEDLSRLPRRPRGRPELKLIK